MRIYRWHITRKLVNPSLDAETSGKVDVIVTPAKEEFPIYKKKDLIRSHYELPKDDLGFWEDEDDLKLEGWTTEQALLQALLSRNLLEDASRIEASAADRRIVEDMVLLQVVEDTDTFSKIWNAAKEDQDLPELTGLVELKGARWIDFTLQARKLAKDIYHRVLVAMRERGYAEQS